MLVKTQRMKGYLIAHLERSFGRPVQVKEFSVQLFPTPRLDLDGVTIGEDPSFGQEYFLRAEHMAASLRWMGLIRWHFDFGTMSLTRPSLVLVRNEQGRWNLEGWLPPVQTASAKYSANQGPRQPAESANFLQKIEFDDGRINFTIDEEKRAFAFTNVSGSVEQMEPGRWRLRLEARPWRSGVALQSTGIIQVRGDLAGTSTRLQPAQLQLHWERISLADLFRLVTGKDPGVRGELVVDANASIGKELPEDASGMREWKFDMQARATQIHRWDLTARGDNPNVNLNLKGSWNVGVGEARTGQLSLEMPHSNLGGSIVAQTTVPLGWNLQVQHLAIQGQDLLAWVRAFQPGIAEGLSVEEFFYGGATLHGWPVECENTKFSSDGGKMTVPGFAQAVKIEPFSAKVVGGRVLVEPVRLLLGAGKASPVTAMNAEKGQSKPRAGEGAENTLEAILLQDFSANEGSLRSTIRLADATRFFKFVSAFGKTINPGWELTGEVSAKLDGSWKQGLENTRWSGTADVKSAELQAAGLNQPLKLEDASVEWREGKRGAVIRRVGAFGATWSGTLEQSTAANSADENEWRFRLHADHLNATELDRWFGPRGRPNWVQRLLSSLLGRSDSGAKPSELLRRVTAEGELTADDLTIEKVKLENARARISLHELQLETKGLEAQWAGGTIHGAVKAAFSPVPSYEITAELNRVDLAQLPWAPKWAERWSGLASGTIYLTTGGVGREELLTKLDGHGEVKLKSVEFRGWDVTGSVESGTVQTGLSRWTSGEGEFVVKGRALDFEALQLEAPHAKAQLAGTFGFGQEGKLTFALLPAGRPGGGKLPASHVLQVNGPLDSPEVAVATAAPAKR